jgi:hypothetical protein
LPNQKNENDLTRENDFRWVANLLNALADFSDSERCPPRIAQKINKVKSAALDLIEAATEWEREEILSGEDHWIQKIIIGSADSDGFDDVFLEANNPNETINFLFLNDVIPETREKDRDRFVEALSAPPIDSARQCELQSGEEPRNYFEKSYLEGRYSADCEEQGPRGRHLARFELLGIVTQKQGRNRRSQPPVSRSLWVSRRNQVLQSNDPRISMVAAILGALYSLCISDTRAVDFNKEFDRSAKRLIQKLSKMLAIPDELDSAHEDFHREFTKLVMDPHGKDTLSKLGREIAVSQDDLERSRKNFFAMVVERMVPIVQEFLQKRFEHRNNLADDDSKHIARKFSETYLEEKLRLTVDNFAFLEYYKRGLIPNELGRAYEKCLYKYASVVAKDLKKRLENILNEERIDS